MKKRIRLATIGVAVAALMVGLVGCAGFTQLSLSASEIEVGIKESATMVATSTGMFGTNDTISASTSDKAVATVAVNGRAIKVTGVTAGTAAITVTNESGSTATCEVTVVTTLYLSRDAAAVTIGSTADVVATAYDSAGEADTITVESSSDAVATAVVDGDGKTVTITGVSVGTATVTVASGSDNEATCAVTVLESDPEINGTWIYLGGDYSSRLEISGGVVRFYSGAEAEIETTDNLFQECEIFGVNNTILNGGDAEATDCGYMVLKYTNPSMYLPNSVNKYGILRWAGFSGSDEMWYSEGYLDTDGDWTGEHFDTPFEAIAGMTTAAGAFYAYPVFYSQATLLE